MTHQPNTEPTLQPENLAQLGKVPDYLLAEILRLPVAEIRAQRERRGIPRFMAKTAVPHSWTAEELKLLGTMTDAAVSGQIGTSELQVSKERQRRGIAACAMTVRQHIWLPEHDAMLGSDTDVQVAIRLGITTRTVAMRRNELGIPRQRKSGTVKGGHVVRTPEEIWTREAISMLGTTSDSMLAVLLRISPAEVRAKRESFGIPKPEPKHPAAREWTREELALLGTMTDADIAKKLRVNRTRVNVRRIAAGIPRFIPQKIERAWTKDEDAMLGVRTDSEIAAKLGITRKIVENRRKQLGVPRQYRNSRPAAG